MFCLKFTLGLAATALVLSPIFARAQTASTADKNFVKAVLETDMAEVQLGQMALDKSSNPEVRHFGQKMMDDHGKINEQIKPIAGQLHIDPPEDLSAMDKTLKARLQGESGTAFDKDYINAMVNGHRGAVAAFKKEASTGKDPAVKDAAAKNEPTIAEHLKMAENLQGKV